MMSQSRRESFGEQLQRYRARAGLTQDTLARRSGLTVATISALERGVRRLPYLHTRQRLAAALGLSPEEATAFAGPRPALSTPNAPIPPPGNLPARRTPLIGREVQVAELRELILHGPLRLVTLTGVGGCGKTRLALQVAAELQSAFPDGGWLVELAPVADPALIPQVIATALDVPEAAGVPLEEMLTAFLRPRTALLVLDNCEHVVEECAQIVERLLSACPTLRILATSREPLKIAGERQRRVPTLAAPDPEAPVTVEEIARYPAVELFLARAQAVAPDFSLTAANAAAVAQICANLDGIPLALELAAARVRVLSVEQVLAYLDDSIRLLTGGSRAAPSRQQTLRATLDWSHDLLAKPEQATFRRLAVFSGGCDLEAVQVVAGTESDPGKRTLDAGLSTLDLLTRLVDKSLLQVDDGPGAARYRLLEPVRQYAGQRLSESGETSHVRTQHLHTYLRLAERATTELRGPDQVAQLRRLEREQGNLRAALTWAAECGDAETGLRLATALAPFWSARGHLGEGRRWLENALVAARHHALPPMLSVRGMIAAGMLAQWQADLDGAAPYLEEALALARAGGCRERVAESLLWLGVVYRRRAAFDRAIDALEECLALYRSLEDTAGVAFALSNLGTTLLNAGDWRRGRELLETCLPLFREVGDVRYLSMSLTMLGATALGAGDRERAAALLREGLAGHVEVGDRGFIIESLRHFARLHADSDPVRAARLLGASETLRESLGVALVPINRIDDHIVAPIRAHLSEAELLEAWTAGRALTQEQAVAEALAARAPDVPVRPRRAQPSERRAQPLTRREEEVARLLALGQSDREIAGALRISVRTAGVHVQNVLGKLDLRSRWQVSERIAALAGPEQRPG